MAKVTSKLQVTVPKAIADRFGIEPGCDIMWEAAHDIIHVIPPRNRPRSSLSEQDRLSSFDAATKRQRRREKRQHGVIKTEPDRGWSREDLYKRGGVS
jgi:AbrB family looped-hinge helix DNA binding protein